MKKNLILSVLLTLFIASFSIGADYEFEGLPIHVKKDGQNFMRIWFGDFHPSTAVHAFATEKGIVIIDTTRIPELDKQYRKIISKEFARDDFLYLINTHGHHDHTFGNGVYADCIIIAQETAKDQMDYALVEAPRKLVLNSERAVEFAEEIKQGKLQGEELKHKQELLVEAKLNEMTYENLPELTYPTLTFVERWGELTHLQIYLSTFLRGDFFSLVT